MLRLFTVLLLAFPLSCAAQAISPQIKQNLGRLLYSQYGLAAEVFCRPRVSLQAEVFYASQLKNTQLGISAVNMPAHYNYRVNPGLRGWGGALELRKYGERWAGRPVGLYAAIGAAHSQLTPIDQQISKYYTGADGQPLHYARYQGTVKQTSLGTSIGCQFAIWNDWQIDLSIGPRWKLETHQPLRINYLTPGGAILLGVPLKW